MLKRLSNYFIPLFVFILVVALLTSSGCGYPTKVVLGSSSANGAKVYNLTITKNGNIYKLTGKSDAPKDGEITLTLSIKTAKGSEKKTFHLNVTGTKGAQLGSDLETTNLIKNVDLKSFVYEPYEFTAKDYPLDPGLKLVYYAEKQTNLSESPQRFPVSFNLEGPWDFSGGPTEGEIVYTYVAPNETPQAADFLGANTARKHDYGNGVVTFYIKKDTDSYQVLGNANKTILSEVSYITKYNPPRLTYKFPFKVGDTWQSVNDITYSGIGSGTGRLEENSKVISRNRIKVPQGEYSKCYLFQSKIHEKDSDGTETTYIQYAWLVPGVGAVAYITSVNGEQIDAFTQASSFYRLKFKGTSKP